MRLEGPDARRAYETACVERIRREAVSDSVLKRDGTTVYDVYAAGEYPDTRIVVDVGWRGRRETIPWRLWPTDDGPGDFGSVPASGDPVPPAIVARDVIIALYELQ